MCMCFELLLGKVLSANSCQDVGGVPSELTSCQCTAEAIKGTIDRFKASESSK